MHVLTEAVNGKENNLQPKRFKQFQKQISLPVSLGKLSYK